MGILQEFINMLNPWYGISEKHKMMKKRCKEIKNQLGVDDLNDIEEIKVYGPKIVIKTKSDKD